MVKKTVNKKSTSKTANSKFVNQINDLKKQLKDEEDKYLRLFAELSELRSTSDLIISGIFFS